MTTLDMTFTRLWSKVAVAGASECWEWKASKDRMGYGHIHHNGRLRPAHRVAWEIANHADAPQGMVVCHSCDNPGCVNPAHLWLGTISDNAMDARKKGRLKLPHEVPGRRTVHKHSHCKRGHPMSGENLNIDRHGKRHCRACWRHWNNVYRQRKVA